MFKTTLGILEAVRGGNHLAVFLALEPPTIDERFKREELVREIFMELAPFDAIAKRIMEKAGAVVQGRGLVFERSTPEAMSAVSKINEMRARVVEFDFDPVDGSAAALGEGAWTPADLAAWRDCGIVKPSKKERKPSLDESTKE